ncbi:two-component system, NarL family, response regulator DesR [Thermoactinomyces sp. DSM 45891]|uniref:response regulator transcription factor n=1 Tax=Thermoactinomyces sp. DSM 45891 TaxID=1761907 RepID=UPI000912B4AF|nr:response regulator transcription factor [Thermoactinomyces sp. DSM 45891]SFX20825.1 two-component system, NarL family, response regulator DesR [Thermoactinomyces sp. DSM 45891]
MIRVVIAEDQGMLRSALGALLDLEEDITVVGQAENGREALELIQQHQPDLCILDIEMPIMSGLEVAEQLKEMQHPCRVVVLTTFARPGYFQRAVATGVQGYLLKDRSSDELTESLRNIMLGKREISPELIEIVWEEKNPLTPREQEILLLAEKGLTTNEIAGQLFLSSGTIRNYLSEVNSKMSTSNRLEAIMTARSKGWIVETP